MSTAAVTVGLVGNPNSGKSTLFNALTRGTQHVGNWSGVTVKTQHAGMMHAGIPYECVDLPGCHDLHVASVEACDQRITCQFLETSRPDVILNVIDASHLMRHLYCTLQLLEMGVPVIVVLNKMDLARKKGVALDVKALSAQLGCPVVATVGHKGQGVEAVKDALAAVKSPTARVPVQFTYPPCIELAVAELIQAMPGGKSEMHPCNRWMALSHLEHVEGCGRHSDALSQRVSQLRAHIQQTLDESVDIVIADARYRRGIELAQSVSRLSPSATGRFSQAIDRLVLNRWLALPVFIGVMTLLFVITIGLGGCFQPAIETLGRCLFIDRLADGLTYLSLPQWLVMLLTEGIGQGLVITLTFVPVLGGLFVCLALIEESGYMSRVAFVMDGLMGWLGLPGKAFISMILGFGCNVPAILAARTLDSQRDRIVTVMMAPFMSCSARLAIYAVFAAAFFPYGSQIVVLMLYLLGILAALFTACILRLTLLPGVRSPLVMELPVYQVPVLSKVLHHAGRRLVGFMKRASRVIVPVCLVISLLNHLSFSGQIVSSQGSGHSMLAGLAQAMTPLFAPLGMTQDNWPAMVALFTGALAKEVVIATLGSLYDATLIASTHFTSVLQGVTAAAHSVVERLMAWPDTLLHPGQLFSLGAEESSSLMSRALVSHFHNAKAAFAYMVFVLLYLPCVSTFWAIRRELGGRWAGFSFFWSLALAYGMSTLLYQMMTLSQHVVYSLVSMSIVLGVWGVVIMILYGIGQSLRDNPIQEVPIKC